MLTARYRSPHDPLARDDLMPVPVRRARLAFKIAVGALGGLLLAAAGGLDPVDADRIDRRALAGSAPQVGALPASPWGQAPRGEGRFSH